MSRAIKKGDVVVVISGDLRHEEKRSGAVMQINHGKSTVIVEGLRIRKIARKRSAKYPQGGLIEKECPIHISNVMLKETFDARQVKRKA